jgi:hypothetical protein
VRPKQRTPALLTLVLAGAIGAAAHPEATLKSPVTTVAAGGTLPLLGEAFLPDQTVKLALQGAFNEYDLPEVQAGTDGKFSIELTVPENVRPGAYRLVAIADDGDVVGGLDITVQPAVAAAVDHAGMDHGEASPGVATEARADDLPIERSRSGIEWGAIGLLIGLSAGYGLSLLRSGLGENAGAHASAPASSSTPV